MDDLGMDFRAPGTDKIKAWEIVRGMYKVGHRFQTCGCLGPGLIPNDPETYFQYLNDNRNEYKRRLETRPSEQSAEELNEYIAYWAERLKLVEKEMEKWQQRTSASQIMR